MHQEKKSDQNIIYSLIHKKMEIIFGYPCIISNLTPLAQDAHRHLHDTWLATRHLSLRQHKPASPPEEVPQTGSREWYLGQPCCCRPSRPPEPTYWFFSSPAREVCCTDAARGGSLWVYLKIEFIIHYKVNNNRLFIIIG